MNYSFVVASGRYFGMKKSLVKYLVLICALTTMTVSTAFAGVNQSSAYQQQQFEQIRQQNDALIQQNEYLKQQIDSLRQQTEAIRQNQAYNQGYIEGQGSGQRNNHYQLYTGMGVGYIMGQWFGPRYHCGWGHRCCH